MTTAKAAAGALPCMRCSPSWCWPRPWATSRRRRSTPCSATSWGSSASTSIWGSGSRPATCSCSASRCRWPRYLSRRFSVRQHVLIGHRVLPGGSRGSICCAPNFGVLLVGRVLPGRVRRHAHAASADHRHDRIPCRAARPPAMGVAGIANGIRAEHRPHHRRRPELLVVAGAATSSCCSSATLAMLAAWRRSLAIRPSDAPDQGRRASTCGLADAFHLGIRRRCCWRFPRRAASRSTSPFVWAPLVVGRWSFLALFVRQAERAWTEPLVSMEISSPRRQYRAGLHRAEPVERLVHGRHAGRCPCTWRGLCGGYSARRGRRAAAGHGGGASAQPAGGRADRPRGRAPGRAWFRARSLATGAVLTVVLCGADTPLLVTVTLFQAVRAVGVSGLVGPLTSWSLARLPRPVGGRRLVVLHRRAAGVRVARHVGHGARHHGHAVRDARRPGLRIRRSPTRLAFGILGRHRRRPRSPSSRRRCARGAWRMAGRLRGGAIGHYGACRTAFPAAPSLTGPKARQGHPFRVRGRLSSRRREGRPAACGRRARLRATMQVPQHEGSHHDEGAASDDAEGTGAHEGVAAR